MEGDVVDGCPAGVVVVEEVLDAAVGQPLRVEVLQAGTTSTPFTAQ